MKRTISITLALLLLLMNMSAAVFADEADPQATVELRGTIADETNAYIPAAPVTLDDGKGNKYTSQSDDHGRYHFNVKPGVYTLSVEVEGFGKFVEQVDLTAKRRETFDIKLKVMIAEQVDVKDNAASISTEPDKNLSAITLTEKDLEALPDDPDELLQTLKQMAGAAGGGDDASVYVGGFRERGQIPPKEAILRISINQNPFSAEFSEPGNFRIDIITKPGADTYHGGFRLNFNDESLNARNASFIDKPAYQMRNFGANFSGPIIRNRWGFFFDMEKRDVDENDLVNATVLNPVTLAPEPFIQSVLTPVRTSNFSIRSDYLATKQHTIGVQYRYNKNESLNQGLNGGFDLPERAFNRTSREDTLRFSFTSIVNEHTVNEARLQLSRRQFDTRALSDAPTVRVLDTFTSGGNQDNLFISNSNSNLDFTNNVTYTWKTHTFKAGFRAEGLRFENINRSNFGGTFTFGSEDGSPLDLFRRVSEGDSDARPSQFTINRGDPFVGFSQWQMGSFIQDDWKVAPRLTLSFGLRHEFQTHLQDKNNFAPRFGLAWNPDKARKTTIRAGAGIFYAGLDNGITADTIRLDGIHQQLFIITRPNFFATIPDVLTGATTRPSALRTKFEGLNDPYTIMSTVSYERPLPFKLVGSIGYTWTRGVHLLRTRNINAPSLDQGGSPVFPFPDQGPILQFESTGLSTRHQLNFNVRTGFSRTFTLFAGYTLASTRSDTDSAYTTPANPFDLATEFGRASFDVRNSVFFGGSYLLPFEIRLSPFFVATSGRPFNITTGVDLNRDTSFSDRPAFANPGDPGAIVTRYGVFNPNPRPGDEIIPRNFGQSPGLVTVNLNVSKTFGFGPPPNNFGRMSAQQNNQQQGNQQQGNQQQGNNRGGNNRGGNNRGGNNRADNNRGGQGGAGGFGGGPVMVRAGGGPGGGPGAFGGFGGDSRHKYNITIGVNAQNLLNHANPAGFSGVLTSSFFGIANRTLPPRRIEAFLRFGF
ncbi:MAG TPA: carboxypeptidase regulatory-like domain-containing protein [Blastocatellia bacterium]|nr:carboxypeptidase regulatory-like domain-containing protein [Blastocatellia bacterium]